MRSLGRSLPPPFAIWKSTAVKLCHLKGHRFLLLSRCSSSQSHVALAGAPQSPIGKLSFGSNMDVAAKALHALGLLTSPNALDASELSTHRQGGFLWIQQAQLPLNEMPLAHKIIYESLSAVNAVIGVQTNAIKHVASSFGRVRPVSQDGAKFYKTVAVCDSIHDAPRVLQSLPKVVVLVVRDTGMMYTFGASIPEAFVYAFYLDTVCQVQILVGSHETIQPADDVWIKARKQVLESYTPGKIEWPAVKAWIQGESCLADAPGAAISSEEQILRQSLSAAHKNVAARGFDQLVWNHISAKFGSTLLVTPGNRMWHDMEPSCLTLGSENITANILHSAVYDATMAKAVVHLHTPAVQAVSSLKQRFIAPTGSVLRGRIATHHWEGVSDDIDECQRVSSAIRSVPGCCALLMHNHGAIAFGETVEDAMAHYMALDAACKQHLSCL